MTGQSALKFPGRYLSSILTAEEVWKRHLSSEMGERNEKVSLHLAIIDKYFWIERITKNQDFFTIWTIFTFTTSLCTFSLEFFGLDLHVSEVLVGHWYR